MNDASGPTLEQVRWVLSMPRPGVRAFQRMAIRPRPGGFGLPAGHRLVEAGVLLLLYPGADGLCIALTRRTERVANHKGQISLPGGAREPADRSILETALRETKEELGVRPERVEVLGPLTPLYIPPSGYRMHPYVAYIAEKPDFRPEPAEVEEILELPLVHLLDPEAQAEETWELRGQRVSVTFYRLGAHKIWGATAMVLSEFEVMLRRACDKR